MAHISLIIGMYGSHSGLFAQLYHMCGYRLHGAIDYHALSTKKAGYGEPTQVVAINERILSHNESRWYDPQPGARLSTWSTNDDIQQQLTAYIDTITSNAIIDDPRLSYTLPFWQGALANVGHDITVVVPYQHPLTHAHAMHMQHHISTRLALALWVAYTLAIEIHSRSIPRFFVAHNAIMRNWHQASQPLIERCVPDGLTAAMTAQLDTYMQMLRLTTPSEPQISSRVRELAIAQLAIDVYTAIQQPIIDAGTMAVLQQRFAIEITDPQYRHDLGQYEVVYNDVFLDPEARIHALHERHSGEMRRQHSEMSTKIRLLHEEQSRKMTELYDKHGKYIAHQSQMFAETLAKHEQQMTHMRTTFEQEIHHLNDKIVAMQTEIDWRTHVATQQQQTLDKLGWAMRIVALGERIRRLVRKP